MSDDVPSNYFTFTEPLVPEGRKVFALCMACQMYEGDKPAVILRGARQFEAYLKESERPKKPKPKIAAVKSDAQ